MTVMLKRLLGVNVKKNKNRLTFPYNHLSVFDKFFVFDESFNTDVSLTQHIKHEPCSYGCKFPTQYYDASGCIACEKCGRIVKSYTIVS
jgi:hypothetical protein